MVVLSVNLLLSSVIVFLIGALDVFFELDVLGDFEKGFRVDSVHVFALHFHDFGFLNEGFVGLLDVDGLSNTKNCSDCCKLHEISDLFLIY